MVTALLRALGFDDATDAPPGEGQDRAPVGAGQDVPPDIQAQQRAVRGAADQWINTPYHMGGSDQKSIDCSGLVNALLRGFGARIPAGHGPSTTGWRNGEMATPVAWDDIRPGDVLLSPANPRDPQAGEHMALYVGGGQMVEAAGPEGAPVRYAAVTNRNLQPYRMREPVPGLQQVTLLAQREGDVPQGAPTTGQPAQAPSVQRIAMNAGANPDLAEIMAAGAKTETPSLNPQAHNTQGEDSVGLWQANRAGGAGQGYSVEALKDPQTNAQAVIGDYQRAYAQGQRQGLQGTDLAVYTYLHAERPTDQAWNGGPATAMRTNYAEVTARSSQGHELQIGGGYAPPAGAPGAANAQAPSGPLQQAWGAAQPVLQRLLAQAGGAAEAVGGAVAGLGATPAHAEALPAGPPPGPTPQVQQPPPDPDQQARNEAAARETALAQGRQQAVEQGLAQGAAAAGTALSQPALTWGGGRNAPPPAAGPTAPSGQSIPVVSGIGDALGAAAQAYTSALRPQGYGWPGRPGGSAGAGAPSAAPSTTPAAAIAETTPPPGQGPAWGTTPGPTGPQPAPPAQAGLPPDTADQRWDNTLLAWVPKTPPPGTEGWQGGGRWQLAPGVAPATAATGPNGLTATPAPNPPGTPVQYVPNQPGPYPQGYFDGVNWHAPTGQAAAAQHATPIALGGGLTFTPSTPNGTSGTLAWEDPNTHAVTQAPYTLGDPNLPAGIGQPQPATPAPMSEYQRVTSGQTATQNDTANQQWWADYQQRVAQTDVTNAAAQQRLAQEAEQHAADLALRQRQANIPTRVGGDLYGPDPNDPSQVTNLGPASQTPGEQASTAYTQAQSNRLALEGTLPTVVNHRVYAPVTNPDTGVSSFQDTGPESMSASEQALAEQRKYEFSNLSAAQQALQQSSQADLAERQSEFQQNLQEKQTESARPYSQMTKAEQARVGIEQQQLGLDTQKLGLQENQAANQIEQLPRGGIMRVDPFTGQSSLINAPEPEAVSSVGGMIYIPGGRNVSVGGHMVSGGPNPYAGVPTGGGGMFPYPGAAGGQQSPYQNWGGQGGAGWGGGASMGGSPGWAPPQQQRQGWMGSGY